MESHERKVIFASLRLILQALYALLMHVKMFPVRLRAAICDIRGGRSVVAASADFAGCWGAAMKCNGCGKEMVPQKIIWKPLTCEMIEHCAACGADNPTIPAYGMKAFVPHDVDKPVVMAFDVDMGFVCPNGGRVHSSRPLDLLGPNLPIPADLSSSFKGSPNPIDVRE